MKKQRNGREKNRKSAGIDGVSPWLFNVICDDLLREMKARKLERV